MVSKDNGNISDHLPRIGDGVTFRDHGHTDGRGIDPRVGIDFGLIGVHRHRPSVASELNDHRTIFRHIEVVVQGEPQGDQLVGRARRRLQVELHFAGYILKQGRVLSTLRITYILKLTQIRRL